MSATLRVRSRRIPSVAQQEGETVAQLVARRVVRRLEVWAPEGTGDRMTSTIALYMLDSLAGVREMEDIGDVLRPLERGHDLKSRAVAHAVNNLGPCDDYKQLSGASIEQHYVYSRLRPHYLSSFLPPFAHPVTPVLAPVSDSKHNVPVPMALPAPAKRPNE